MEQFTHVKSLAWGLAPSEGSTTCSLKHKARAWFHEWQGLPTTRLEASAQGRLQHPGWHRPCASAGASGFPRTSGENVRGMRRCSLEAHWELPLSSTGFARPPCFTLRDSFLSPQSGGLRGGGGEGGREAAEPEKLRLWSQA